MPIVESLGVTPTDWLHLCHATKDSARVTVHALD